MSGNTGKIDISKLKVPPANHELDTARFFAVRGYDIEFIPPSNNPGIYSADIIMIGIEWEIKSPIGSSRNTLSRNLKRAAKQSHNVILDLRRSKIPENTAVLEIEKRFSEHQSIKRILVIKKNGDLLDYSSKGKRIMVDK